MNQLLLASALLLVPSMAMCPARLRALREMAEARALQQLVVERAPTIDASLDPAVLALMQTQQMGMGGLNTINSMYSPTLMGSSLGYPDYSSTLYSNRYSPMMGMTGMGIPPAGYGMGYGSQMGYGTQMGYGNQLGYGTQLGYGNQLGYGSSMYGNGMYGGYGGRSQYPYGMRPFKATAASAKKT